MNFGTHAYSEAPAPYTSVIVAVYKNVPFLELVLLSLERQSYRNFEVIIAEDDEDSNLQDFNIRARNNFSFPILHVHQPDEGFLKNKILNKAVLASNGKYPAATAAEAAVGYGKAAMLFVMLQDRIGEAAFREGIRSLWACQRFRTAGLGRAAGGLRERLGPSARAVLRSVAEAARAARGAH